jgi:energy-coupling factor transport system ATP-binding protein
VFAEHGAALAARGVWVPGRTPQPLPHPTAAPVPGDELLVAHDLAVTRPARARAGLPPVLTGVDLTVRAGTATCLAGPNGAGKSTLALTLAGLMPPAAGDLAATVALRDGLREGRPHRWRARDLVRRIGTVFQEPEHQFVAPTVAAELTVGPRAAGVRGPELEERAGQLLERLRLGHLARANPYTLSGGEQRRLSVAGVLAARPRVLVLDEPTFGQDARTWAELVALLRELMAEGTAVVAATHDEALVDALGARAHRVAPHAEPVPAS